MPRDPNLQKLIEEFSSLYEYWNNYRQQLSWSATKHIEVISGDATIVSENLLKLADLDKLIGNIRDFRDALKKRQSLSFWQLASKVKGLCQNRQSPSSAEVELVKSAKALCPTLEENGELHFPSLLLTQQISSITTLLPSAGSITGRYLAVAAIYLFVTTLVAAAAHAILALFLTPGLSIPDVFNYYTPAFMAVFAFLGLMETPVVPLGMYVIDMDYIFNAQAKIPSVIGQVVCPILAGISASYELIKIAEILDPELETLRNKLFATMATFLAHELSAKLPEAGAEGLREVIDGATKTLEKGSTAWCYRTQKNCFGLASRVLETMKTKLNHHHQKNDNATGIKLAPNEEELFRSVVPRLWRSHLCSFLSPRRHDVLNVESNPLLTSEMRITQRINGFNGAAA